MKSKYNVVLLMVVTLMLSACGKQEDAVMDLSDLFSQGGSSSNGSQAKLCSVFTGNFSSGGIADLSILQDACDQVKIVQDCHDSICGMAGIESYSVELSLDGSSKVVDGKTYSATVDESNLTVLKTYPSGRKVTRVYTRSSSPCGYSISGLQVEETNEQGPVTTTSCQAWFH